MFRLFILLLSFSESLATKCLFWNDEPCMVRATLTNMDLVEFKYYLFMNSLNKCSGSCNVWSPTTCVPKKTKDINVEAFNIITKKDETKAMTEHVPVIVNANSIVKHAIQKKNGIIKDVYVNVKIIVSAKKIIVGMIATCICENSKYLKSIADTSVTQCDKIVNVMDIVSKKTKKTNTIATNVTITAWINCHSKKVSDCYVLHTVLLAIILLLKIIYNHYAKQFRWHS